MRLESFLSLDSADIFLHRGKLDDQRLAEALEKIYTPPPSVHVADRDALCDLARERIGKDPILYLEFGVKGGKSMARMLERFTHPHSRFVGFDSFEGLPEDWQHLDAGTFSKEGRMPHFRDVRATFVKGWFQDTLPDFLKTYDLDRGETLLVNYDADLYGSTLFVLAALWLHTREHYFMFDEFMQDEAVALYDFTRAFPVELEFFAQTDTPPFKQVFGRMRRTELRPKTAALA